MFITISTITSSMFILSKVITIETFAKHKNIVLGISSLTINNHITTNNVTTI